MTTDKLCSFIRFYGLLGLATLYYFGVGFIRLLYRPKDDVVYWAAHGWGNFTLKQAGIRVEVDSKEHLQKTPAIFVLNHQSMLDLFILCALLPLKTLPVAKKSFKYIPILGCFMKSAGVVFLDRYHPQKAMVGMKKVQKLALEGYSLIMAPEGTRTRTGELQPLKKGAFYLALQTGLPLVPITIVGAFNLFPKSRWTPQSGTVKVFINPPISTLEWTGEDLPKEIEKVRNIFLSHLEM